MSKIVVENTRVIKKIDYKNGYSHLTLAPFSKTGQIRPGQFVHVGIPCHDIYFRRAFSVYYANPAEKSISILIKRVGRGTKHLVWLNKGDEVSVIGPLGNGFKRPGKKENVILIAGGVGLPPIYLLARSLVENGYDKKRLYFFYGAINKSELIDLNKIRQLQIQLITATDDGSKGFKGFITSAIAGRLDEFSGACRVYACGPEPMLQAVERLAKGCGWPGQLSLEAPMPCGVGICLGCVRPLTAGGYTRVCYDGPVYNIGEVLL